MTPANETTVKKTAAKFADGETRRAAYKRVINLYKEGGLTSQQIAEKLAEEGFRKSDGSTAGSHLVNNIINRWHNGEIKLTRKRVTASPARARANGHAPEARRVEKLPDTVVGILTDPNLDAERKVKLIFIYADL